MTKKTSLRSAITIVFVTAIIVSIATRSKTASEEATSTLAQTQSWWYDGTIKVWHLVALDMAPMFVAKEAGYFAEEWLDVETVFFSNPWDNNAALAWGDLQFHINPFTLPFLAQNQWLPMRIISSAWWLEIIEVVVQGKHNIESIAWLENYVTQNPNKKFRIGTLKGDTLDMIIYKTLQEKWLSYDDFEMIRFNDLLAMVQAFQSEQIDILSHIKPYTTDLVINHDAVVLTNNDSARGEATPNTTTVVMENFAKKYPETVKAYLRAQKKWFELIVNHPERALALLEKGNYYRVPSDVLLSALKTQKKVILQPNVSWMIQAIEDMVSQWYIDPVDEHVIDLSFLQELAIS